MKKKKIILAATSALAVLALAACSGSTNKDIATMKGGTITVEDFYNEAKHTQNNQQLVQNMIIYKAFENKYGDKVTDKDVNAEYKKNEETYGDTFKSQLEAAGYTEDSYKQALRSSLVLKAGISANVKVTEKDLKEAWKTFHPEVEAQIIKVSSEDEAKEVKKSADDGTDFVKLAKEKSTDEATKKDGGKIKFDSQTTDVPTEVKEAAFKLKDGQVSDVISATNTTSYSTDYYVVKMVKNQNKGDDMNKYKKQLESIARDTKESDQDLQKEIIAKVLKEENVKVTDDAFKNVLTPFTMETANTNTSESKTKSTKSSESKTTESTKTSESSTTESSSK
ncbi:peptidylprolyl isomerase [Enterococcus hirae]|uniref:peptidylprolyl isomerase n=1 Tax=Enterococcus hirae TaxID=1354 RepID=UPI000F6F2F64|nr:peptidylprolyl isomerase [Enterococcus hirae]MBA5270635.1 peptidylprolyl isomerase [Enterococcus hirae]MDU4894309.1 peptidylprolyl isomerase [Enterococcus hirae]NVM00598.1 peptidylprolyl isomerase [Enterococcus hirae]VEE77066.1 rotamase family protein [Enterococcus hirae]